MHMKTAEGVLEKIRIRRDELRLSHDAVAADLGLERSTYTRKENGDVPLTLEEFYKIVKVLGTTDIDLMSGGESKESLSELDREMILLRSKISQYGGVDKAKKLRLAIPKLFDLPREAKVITQPTNKKLQTQDNIRQKLHTYKKKKTA